MNAKNFIDITFYIKSKDTDYCFLLWRLKFSPYPCALHRPERLHIRPSSVLAEKASVSLTFGRKSVHVISGELKREFFFHLLDSFHDWLVGRDYQIWCHEHRPKKHEYYSSLCLLFHCFQNIFNWEHFSMQERHGLLGRRSSWRKWFHRFIGLSNTLLCHLYAWFKLIHNLVIDFRNWSPTNPFILHNHNNSIYLFSINYKTHLFWIYAGDKISRLFDLSSRTIIAPSTRSSSCITIRRFDKTDHKKKNERKVFFFNFPLYI